MQEQTRGAAKSAPSPLSDARSLDLSPIASAVSHGTFHNADEEMAPIGIPKKKAQGEEDARSYPVELCPSAETSKRPSHELSADVFRNDHACVMQYSDKITEIMNSKPTDPTALRAGTPAPAFTLRSTPDQSVSLAEFRGRPVVLAFYPADWSPVCGDQMGLYNELLSEFQSLGAELLGISVDGTWCHAAFRQQRKFQFPLLSDFEPKGAVSRLYGVYRAEEGLSERALFVIDPSGIIHWSYVSPVGVNPGAAGILAALDELQSSRSQHALASA